MHVLPAKHNFARLPRKCDYRTDTQTDKVIPMCHYASQGTQKRMSITYKIIYLLLSVGPVWCWFCLSVQYVAVCPSSMLLSVCPVCCCLSVRPSVCNLTFLRSVEKHHPVLSVCLVCCCLSVRPSVCNLTFLWSVEKHHPVLSVCPVCCCLSVRPSVCNLTFLRSVEKHHPVLSVRPVCCWFYTELSSTQWKEQIIQKERILCSGFLYSSNLQQNKRTHE